MKKLSVVLAISSFMTAGPALALEEHDPDLLSPKQRALNKLVWMGLNLRTE